MRSNRLFLETHGQAMVLDLPKVAPKNKCVEVTGVLAHTLTVMMWPTEVRETLCIRLMQFLKISYQSRIFFSIFPHPTFFF